MLQTFKLGTRTEEAGVKVTNLGTGTRNMISISPSEECQMRDHVIHPLSSLDLQTEKGLLKSHIIVVVSQSG